MSPSKGIVAFAMVVAAGACASHRVLEPPRLNLVPYGRVGLVTFTAENARGSLKDYTTKEFEEYLLAAQSGVEVIEFDRADSAQALAAGNRGVPVAFFGHLRLSDIKPSGGLGFLSVPHMEAHVTADLSVELRSTETGGVLWRSSARTREKIGGIAIVGGQPVFEAHDPNEAYGRLVDRLLYSVTYDLRSTWVKR